MLKTQPCVEEICYLLTLTNSPIRVTILDVNAVTFILKHVNVDAAITDYLVHIHLFLHCLEINNYYIFQNVIMCNKEWILNVLNGLLSSHKVLSS